jgi:hypothetical protein
MAASRILVGYDTGAHAVDAFALGPVLSRATGTRAEVRLIGVAPSCEAPTADPAAFGWGAAGPCGDLRARLCAALDSAADRLPAGVGHSGGLFTGRPAAVLLDQVRRLDLLVLGWRG